MIVVNRNMVCFYFLGLLNNFGYKVIMATAKDMMKEKAPTSVVLMFNIIPGFLITLAFPMF